MNGPNWFLNNAEPTKAKTIEANQTMNKLSTQRIALAFASLAVMLLVFAGPAMASTTQTFQATFVEIGFVPGSEYSCGSGTISELGHVANECVVFDACGPNCEVRTIVFDDGSTLVIHESIVGFIPHGNSPGLLQITLAIDGASSTGRFAGATGDGIGVVNLAANAVIIASGTITLQP